MKSLTIQYTDGSHESYNVEDGRAGEAVSALSSQNPAFPLVIGQATVHINMRQVCSVAVGEAEKKAEPEPDQPSQKMIPDPDPNADPDRTVAQLKEALDAAQVEYPADARKADLQKLATEHGV